MQEEQFFCIYPLEQEEAGVAFYNGLLWALPAALAPEQLPWHAWQSSYPGLTLREILEKEQNLFDIHPGDRVTIWHFPDLTLPASEFSTNNGSSHTYVQRL